MTKEELVAEINRWTPTVREAKRRKKELIAAKSAIASAQSGLAAANERIRLFEIEKTKHEATNSELEAEKTKHEATNSEHEATISELEAEKTKHEETKSELEAMKSKLDAVELLAAGRTSSPTEKSEVPEAVEYHFFSNIQ